MSARGGRQGNDDLIWDGKKRFLTYTITDLQLFKMFIAILCLNGVKQPFKRHQCPFFLPLRRGNPRLRRGSFHPRGGRPPQRPPPPGSAPGHKQGCARLMNHRQYDSSYQPLAMDSSPQLPFGTNYTTSTIVPRSNRTHYRRNRTSAYQWHSRSWQAASRAPSSPLWRC